MNKKFLNLNMKIRITTALMIAPSLAMMLISAAYCVSVGGFNITNDNVIPILMSVLTVISLTASTVLLFLHKRKLPLVFLSVLFILCLICHVAFFKNGMTDIYRDGVIESFMLVFTIPAMSYMPFASLFSSTGAIPVILITAYFVLINTSAVAALAFLDKRQRKDKEQ